MNRRPTADIECEEGANQSLMQVKMKIDNLIGWTRHWQICQTETQNSDLFMSYFIQNHEVLDFSSHDYTGWTQYQSALYLCSAVQGTDHSALLIINSNITHSPRTLQRLGFCKEFRVMKHFFPNFCANKKLCYLT